MSKIIQGRAVSKIMFGGREIVRSVYQGRDVYDASGGGAGGIDEYTTLLLHFDGSCADSSPLHLTPQVLDVAPEFGQAASGFGQSFANANNARVRFADAEAFNFLGNPWTVDFKAYFASVGFPDFSISCGENRHLRIRAGLHYNIRSFIVEIVGQHIHFSLQGVIKNDEWNHFALVGFNGSLLLFINGKLQVTAHYPDLDPTTEMIIGNNYEYAGHHAYLDELRVSKVARWTADFEPPAKPYS